MSETRQMDSVLQHEQQGLKERDPIAARGSKQPGFPACHQSVVVPGLQRYSL